MEITEEVYTALKLTLYELKNKRFKKPSEFLDKEIKEVESLIKKYESQNNEKSSDKQDVILNDEAKH